MVPRIDQIAKQSIRVKMEKKERFNSKVLSKIIRVNESWRLEKWSQCSAATVLCIVVDVVVAAPSTTV